MRYIKGADLKIQSSSIVTIGNFDGLHLGHRKLIEEVKKAAKNGEQRVVFSFFPHPLCVLRPNENPCIQMILSPEEKSFLLSSMGIDYFIEYPFTEQFAKMSPEDFIRDVLHEKLHCKLLIVGEGYKFGKNQSGNTDIIRTIGKKYGMDIMTIPHVEDYGKKISSSEIRKLIEEKDFKLTEKYLCQPYFIIGQVSEGKKVGRSMGFPTVNLIPYENKLLPPDGVYLTKTYIKDLCYNSLTNIGNNPTVSGSDKTIETYLFDFDSNIYGEIIRIDFYKWLRNEIRFSNLSELQNQISTDVKMAGEYFNSTKQLK